MLLLLLTQLVWSKITLSKPDHKEGEMHGLFDINYQLANKKVPFSLNNLGTIAKLIVNGTSYYPKDLDGGPFGGLQLDLNVDHLADDDAFITFTFTNKNDSPVEFSFSTYTDISFKDEKDGNCNYIRSMADGDTKTRYLIRCKNIQPDWQALVIDHGNFPGRFIQATNFWYGIKTNDENRYFAQVDHVWDRDDPEGDDKDLAIACSWKNKIIGPEVSVTYGVHIFFNMERRLNLLPIKDVIAVEPGKTADVTCTLRLLLWNQKTDCWWNFADKPNHEFGGNFWPKQDIENFTFHIPTENTIGENMYKLMCEIYSDKTNYRTLEPRVRITRSYAPTLEIKKKPSTSKLYNNTDVLPFVFKLSESTSSDKLVDITFELYRNDILIDSKTHKFQQNDLNSKHKVLNLTILLKIKGLDLTFSK